MDGNLTEHSSQVLNVAGAAHLLGTSEKSIRQRIARRLLPFRKLGGRVIFLRAELESFLAGLPGCTSEEANQNVERQQ